MTEEELYEHAYQHIVSEVAAGHIQWPEMCQDCGLFFPHGDAKPEGRSIQPYHYQGVLPSKWRTVVWLCNPCRENRIAGKVIGPWESRLNLPPPPR